MRSLLLIPLMLSILFVNKLLARELSLDQIIELGGQQSLKVKLEQAKLEELKAKVDEANANFYPEMSVIIGHENRKSSDDSNIDKSNSLSEVRLNYSLTGVLMGQSKRNSARTLMSYQKKQLHYAQFFLRNELEEEFYNALYFKELIQLYQNELKHTAALKKKVTKRRKQGLVDKSDVLEIDMRSSYLSEESLILEEKYHHQIDDIKKISNFGHMEEIGIVGELTYSPVSVDPDLLYENLKSFNREYLENQAKLLSAEYDTSNAQRGRLPELSLMGRYGNMRIDEQYTNNNSQESLVGFYLSLPLFDGGKRRSVSEIYKAKLAQEKINFQKEKNSYEIEIRHKVEKLDNLKNRVELGSKNLKVAERYYRQVRSEYERGVKNSLDLVSARERLFQFKQTYLRSVKDYILTTLEIEKMTGVSLRS